MKVRILLSFMIIALTLSCEENEAIDVNLTSFEQITERFPFDNLQPAEGSEYWELNHHMDDKTETIASMGTLCAGSENPDECADAFQLITSGYGFGEGCLPGTCFFYVKLQQAGEILLLKNKSEVRNFLGEINSKSDAILLAVAEGYGFSTEKKEAGAIREKGSSAYQLLVTKLVKSCSPIQTNRYLLEISRDGTLIIKQEEERYAYIKNGCP